MTDKQQPEALRLAEMLTADEWPGSVTLVSYAHECVAELLAQQARITELESQLAQRFDAADVATASAQGFRDGAASVSAGSEPVAWKHDCAALLANDVELWIDACPHCGKPRMHATQAAHPSPPEGMAGWMPIETAPKDGQAILVTDGMYCYCVEWDEEFDWWTVDDNKLGPFRLRGSAPTHWRPLPAAPGPADGESK